MSQFYSPTPGAKAFAARTTSFLVAALLGLFILSVAYIVKEADHDCQGEGCPVCETVLLCGENLQLLGTGVAHPDCVLRFFAGFAAEEARLFVGAVLCLTLVAQKVRLNN